MVLDGDGEGEAVVPELPQATSASTAASVASAEAAAPVMARDDCMALSLRVDVAAPDPTSVEERFADVFTGLR